MKNSLEHVLAWKVFEAKVDDEEELQASIEEEEGIAVEDADMMEQCPKCGYTGKMMPAGADGEEAAKKKKC